MFTDSLPEPALDQLFIDAHSCWKYLDREVDDATLLRLHDLMKWGPTSMNCQPMRLVFLRSEAAKRKLEPALMPGNVDKTMAGPVVAIVAYDTRFFEHLPTQFPVNPGARDMFASNVALAGDTAYRNGTLQGAYLMLAARSLGMSVGPMSGFDQAKVNEAFFADGRWKANFLFILGWGDPEGVKPRNPRLDFTTVARVE